MKMFRWLKILPLALAALAVAALSIVAASCNSGNQPQARFVHAIQDGGELDIEVNGSKDFSGLSFGNFLPLSGYTNVTEGSDTIEGLNSGTSTEVFSVSGVTFDFEIDYTVVATGFVTNFSSVVIISTPDNTTEPANGTVSFRVINASPDSPGPVDIYILDAPVAGGLPAKPTISSLAYKSVSGYINLPYNSAGGGFTMFVCPAGTRIPIFSTGWSFAAGASNEGSTRTLVLTDEQNVNQMSQYPIFLKDIN
jgi:hypothetical protein